jgi:hypothetical protein
MLRRVDLASVSGDDDDASEIQLEFAFLLPPRLDLVPPLQIKRRQLTQRKQNDDGQN